MKEHNKKKQIAFWGLAVSEIAIWFLDISKLMYETAKYPVDPINYNVTNISLKVIFGLFLVGLFYLIARWELIQKFAESIPEHLPALGILGTFIGIFLGLWKFDASNLKESVPHLLDGLKIAFSTSILGLGCSTVLKVTNSFVIAIFGEDTPPSSIDNFTDSGGLFSLILLTDEEFDRFIVRLKKVRGAINTNILDLLFTEYLKQQHKKANNT